MKTKLFEVRDVGTFIPVIAVVIDGDDGNEAERYLMRRSGYACHVSIMLVRLDANGTSRNASYDPYGWGGCRTMTGAHAFIEENWPNLESGQVIDVEFISGESETCKVSERLEISPVKSANAGD